MIRYKKLVLIGITLLLLAAAAWGALWFYATRSHIPDGVRAGGADIGGLPADEAITLLSENWNQAEQRKVIIEGINGKQQTWALKELGYQIKREQALAAIRKLEEGSLWERARYRYHFPKELVIEEQWRQDIFTKMVKKEWAWMEAMKPADAVRKITPDDRVLYQPHNVGYKVDEKKLLEQVKQAVKAGSAPSSAEEAAPIRLPLPFTKVMPAVTLEQLKAQGVDRMIVSFSTSLGSSSAGRVHNVSVTARVLSDLELKPGEVFDYGKIVQAAEQEYGYREAPVILNGKLAPGIGGGICQVSSTLYHAALQAGLEIVERRNHSLPVSYIPRGQDATFAQGAINFRFKNTTGKHLVIKSRVENGTLTVKLFGTMPENERYEIESETVELIDPPVKEITDPGAPLGSRRVIEQGKAGYKVETYRIHYRDGKAVKRELISRDTYKGQPTVVQIGGSKPNKSSSSKNSEPLLEDGITAAE
ncbi:VanW family protein [Paenibacillus tarimensis]|uniref:VanW family protein n=1 Tax=Paenibacillus tarimensis TaxID=416012 RepID=UPI001F203CF3|nr:VanW family protein [Paenibacillus tarimensis]MCF2944093.1 VanW family protein [Paenibacillus tarimensis]